MSMKPTSISVISVESPETKQTKFSFNRIVKKFRGDRRGSTGMMFAMMIVPLMGLVGAGLDFNSYLGVKVKMQGALDSATLAGGRELQVTGDADAAWEAAENYFNTTVASLPNSNFTDTDTRPALTVTQGDAIDLNNNSVNLTAGATFRPSFLPIIGINELNVRVNTAGVLKQGTPGNNGYLNLELSLMLDVTGSMGGTKIQALKDSAKDLVQIVLDNGNQDEYTSKVALAPFAMSVNVGSGSTYVNVVTGYTAISSLIPGLDDLPAAPAGPEFAQVTPRFSSSSAIKTGHGWGGGGWGGCPWWNPNCNGGNNGGGNNCPWWNPNCNGGNGGGNGVSAPVTNCVSERTGVNAYTDVAPDQSTSNTLFPNVTSSSNCPGSNAKIMPLTDDQSDLEDAIDALPASGSTAGHLGVAWSWYLVSPKWASMFPDNVPAEYEGDTKKVVVLMSDGEFNKEYDGPDSAAQARSLCDNMKAEGIEIFTVGFQLTDATARETMEYCASAPVNVHRFFAESTHELQTSYRQIGFGLKDLKITN